MFYFSVATRKTLNINHEIHFKSLILANSFVLGVLVVSYFFLHRIILQRGCSEKMEEIFPCFFLHCEVQVHEEMSLSLDTVKGVVCLVDFASAGDSME